MQSDIRNRIVALRRRLGLSRQQFAALLGVSAASISRWERGLATPSAALRWRIERAECESTPASQQGSAPPPEPATPPQPPLGNLPRPRSSFVGREQAIARLSALLRSHSAPPVTLVGPGGAGKTRLAIAAARTAADTLPNAFPDGAWFVALEGIGDPDLVTQAVAATIGVRETPGRSLADSLVARLQTGVTLLVLDNCEHLLDACAGLTRRLIADCPRLALLATSRTPLALPGERVWLVPPLSLPEEDRPPESGEAVRLFVERARALDPAFQAAGGRGAAVTSVCRQLDGLPLAVELAAARTRLLTPEQIAERLDDRFRLLVRNERTAPPRHRTLRAAIDWSFELLDALDRRIFARLAVFAGGFDAESAAPVCSGGPVAAEAVAGAVARLVRDSLVVARGDSVRGQSRYQLLETLRAYARERLDESGETVEVVGRHAAFMRTLAESAAERLSGAEQGNWLAHLDEEIDNLRAALAACSSGAAPAEDGLRIAARLQGFWESRGYLAEGRRWLTALLQAAPTAPTALRAAALRAAGLLAWRQDDLQQSQQLAEQALALFHEAGDRKGLADSLNVLSTSARLQFLLGEAHDYSVQAAAIFRELGDETGYSAALNALGLIARESGDFEGARAYHVESLALAERRGDLRAVAVNLNNLGIAAESSGNFDEAREFWGRALELHQRLGNKPSQAGEIWSLGQLAMAQGDFATAETLLGQARALYLELGQVRAASAAIGAFGHIARLRGEVTAAVPFYRQALDEALAIAEPVNLAWCLWGPALLALARGEQRRAARWLAALEHSRKELHYLIWPSIQLDLETALPRLEQAISRDERAAAQRDGEALSLEQLAEEMRTALSAWAAEDAQASADTADADTGERTAAATARSTTGPALSPREQEVLAYLATGATNREIARQLDLSVRTVERHVAGVYTKLGARGRAEAVRTAVERSQHQLG